MKSTKYETVIKPNMNLICEWVSKGYTSKTIADKLHIAVSTFKKYKKEHKELSDAFARAQEEPNEKVENALFKRACGYRWVKVKIRQHIGRDGKIIELTDKETVDVPPDPTTLMFWLTNMSPDKWRYRPETKQELSEEEAGGVVELPSIVEITAPEYENEMQNQ